MEPTRGRSETLGKVATFAKVAKVANMAGGGRGGIGPIGPGAGGEYAPPRPRARRFGVVGMPSAVGTE